MLGCYDFCAHYDWTFRWLEENGGTALLHRYWEEAIQGDAQQHAARLIAENGLEGMKAYWGHTLSEEAPAGGYTTRVVKDRFQLEIADCPSRGFLLRNKVGFSHDYCDHCIGWIGPMMANAGYTVYHAHNHCGQCFWEFRPKDQVKQPGDEIGQWKKALQPKEPAPAPAIDVFRDARSAADKENN